MPQPLSLCVISDWNGCRILRKLSEKASISPCDSISRKKLGHGYPPPMSRRRRPQVTLACLSKHDSRAVVCRYISQKITLRLSVQAGPGRPRHGWNGRIGLLSSIYRILFRKFDMWLAIHRHYIRVRSVFFGGGSQVTAKRNTHVSGKPGIAWKKEDKKKRMTFLEFLGECVANHVSEFQDKFDKLSWEPDFLQDFFRCTQLGGAIWGGPWPKPVATTKMKVPFLLFLRHSPKITNYFIQVLNLILSKSWFWDRTG